MNVFNDIKTGLEQAIAYERGELMEHQPKPILSAEDARNITANPIIEGELNIIGDFIRNDARRGKKSTWFFGKISNYCVEQLESLGYKVTLHWWGTNISWREVYDKTNNEEENKEDKE